MIIPDSIYVEGTSFSNANAQREQLLFLQSRTRSRLNQKNHWKEKEKEEGRKREEKKKENEKRLFAKYASAKRIHSVPSASPFYCISSHILKASTRETLSRLHNFSCVAMFPFPSNQDQAYNNNLSFLAYHTEGKQFFFDETTSQDPFPRRKNEKRMHEVERR